MSDKERGLYTKYKVYQMTEPKDDEVTYWSLVPHRVFVLDPQKDSLARVALRWYARAADLTGHKKLAEDLREWLRGIEKGRED